MIKKLFPFVTLIFIISIALAGCGPKDVSIDVYAGDAFRVPLKEIKASYEAQNPHVTINYNFAAAKVLAETIRIIEQGDIIMGGSSTLNDLDDDGLLISKYPVVTQVAIVAVKEGDTVISSWDDLANEGVRIALVNPEMSIIGVLAQKMVSESPAIQANITVLTSDVSEALALINNGEVDASIVVPSLALKTEGIATLVIPDDISAKIPVMVGVPIYTTNEKEALAFAEFIASEEGKAFFLSSGFEETEK